MFDGGDRNAVAEIDRGAQRRAGNAGKMHRHRADDRIVLEFALDLVAAVDRGRLYGQGNRLGGMHAKSAELEHTANGALARRQVLHKGTTPTLRPGRVLTKKKPARKRAGSFMQRLM